MTRSRNQVIVDFLKLEGKTSTKVYKEFAMMPSNATAERVKTEIIDIDLSYLSPGQLKSMKRMKFKHVNLSNRIERAILKSTPQAALVKEPQNRRYSTEPR